jgi:hypothetical protein
MVEEGIQHPQRLIDRPAKGQIVDQLVAHHVVAIQ